MSFFSRLLQPRFHRHHHHHHAKKKEEKTKEPMNRTDTPRVFTKRETVALTSADKPERVLLEEEQDDFSSQNNFQRSSRRRDSGLAKLIAEKPTERWDFDAKEAPARFAKSVLASTEYQDSLRIGRLKVKVLEAVNLPGVLFAAVGEASTANPYVVLTLEGRAWRSDTKRRTLNPKWRGEDHDKDHLEVSFHVNRYDAVLSVQIYDEGHDHDDRLGHVEIPVRRLAGHGTIRRFFLLKSHFFVDDFLLGSSSSSSSSSQPSTVKNAAVELELTYDVSPLGEAATMVWLDGPKKKPPIDQFDVNCFYKRAMDFKAELTPYLEFARKAEAILKWTDPAESRLYFFAALLLALRWDLFFSLAHCYVVSVLLRNYFAAKRTECLREKSFEIFRAIDADASSSLSRAELGLATRQLLAAAGDARDKEDPPTEKDLDNLFAKFAKGKKELTMDDFGDLVTDCPQIIGAYNTLKKITETYTEHDLDAFISDESDSADNYDRGGSSMSSSSSSSSYASSSTIIFRSSNNDAGGGRSDDQTSSDVTARDVIVHAAAAQGGGTTRKTSSRSSKQGAMKNSLVKNVMNRVGRRLSFLAYASHKFGSTAADLALVRRVFQWDPKVATLATMAVAANVVLAWLSRVAPTAYFVFFVCGAFFYYSDKRRALERLATKGPGAYRRYQNLRDGRNLDMDVLIDDGRPPSAAEINVRGGDFRSKALTAVVRSIFNRLDRDEDGTVSIAELLDFVLAAIPRATPSIRGTGDDPLPVNPKEIEAHAKELVDEYDSDGDGKLDFDEMFNFVTNAGCAKLLLQDELRRQLLTTGVTANKLPSTHATGNASGTKKKLHHDVYEETLHNAFGSHHTKITLVEDLDDDDDKTTTKENLAYTNRYGHAVILRNITAVEAHATRPHVVHVTHKDHPRYAAKTLILSMSEILRDPLVETLQFELIGRHLSSDEAAAATKKNIPPSPPASKSDREAGGLTPEQMAMFSG